MFSPFGRIASYTNVARVCLRAESHILAGGFRTITTSNDVKNSEALTKTPTVLNETKPVPKKVYR